MTRHSDDPRAKKRIMMAMSGGVDSSVAAGLLKEMGHEVFGVTLHLWDAEAHNKVGRCCSPTDREDAKEACEAIGIPHYVIDERQSFRTQVVDPFIETYLKGKTPSPCVTCNQHVKLGFMMDLIRNLGADAFATGHYAQIEANTGRLFRGTDSKKDQSYFLYGVPEHIRRHMILPLGNLTKEETREHGKRLGIPHWDKPDSQELCFVPDGNIHGFIQRERPHAIPTGQMLSSTGDVLGTHDGITQFTVGQRKGLQLISEGPDSKPRYVLRIEPSQSQVIIGDESQLFDQVAKVDEATWTQSMPETFDATLQIRYKHHAAPAHITKTQQGFIARFKDPQRAIAPGQAAVIYQGTEVIGGGFLS